MEDNTEFIEKFEKELCSGRAFILYQRNEGETKESVQIEGSYIATALGCCELMIQTVKRQGDTLNEQMQLLSFLYNTAKEYLQKSNKAKSDE